MHFSYLSFSSLVCTGDFPSTCHPFKYIQYTESRKHVLTISSTGDKNLNLPVRQVEPANLEIVFCEHREAIEEPVEVLLQLVLTGANITGPPILPAAVTHISSS